MHYLEFDPQFTQDPARMVTTCLEQEAGAILIDQAEMPAEYFDLSTGLLGELLHKMSLYRLKLALVLPQPGHYSDSFQAFLHEARQGDMIIWFSTRREAVSWLDRIESGGSNV